MNDASILLALKNNLDIIPTDTTRDDYLKQLIAAAKAMIKREGVTLGIHGGWPADRHVCRLYVPQESRLGADHATDAPVGA